nr:hypothetical protein [Tanacetum cinerariifolium]
MSLTFADTHNMVAYLNKSDASKGFNQVIDFLKGSYIKYALTINPNIYASCIKQFWNTVVVKQTNDVTRLQALVDRRKMVITEAAIKDVLRLDDVEGSMRAKCTSWDEFSSTIAFVIICLSTGDLLTHTTEYTSPAMTQKVFTNMRRVGKGFLGVETPLFVRMLVAGVIEEEGDEEEQDQDDVDDAATQGADTASQRDDLHAPSIPSPTPLTPPPQQSQDLPSMSQKFGTSQRSKTSDDTVMEDASKQGRMIDDFDKDDDDVLMDDKEEKKKEEEVKDDQVQGWQAEIYKIDMDHASKVLSMQEDDPAKVQEVVDVVTTAKLITEVITTASEIVTAASTTISTAEPQVHAAAITTAAPVRVVAAPTRRKKEVVIRDPEEESTTIILSDTKSKDKGKGIMDIDWDVAIEHLKQKAKEDPFVQRYQVRKKRPQTEVQARKNMIISLKNVVGFRLDYFKGMSYDNIRLIFEA